MKILVTSNGYEDDPVVYNSAGELEAQLLHVGAPEEYVETVLSQLLAGARKVTVENGPQAYDTYTVAD
jgi:hypothetical protein